ncbi:MAG: hypothetical protein Q7J46_14230 [Pseudomonas sp.]|nr:hypothetical protein [Pseudomonas sp.]
MSEITPLVLGGVPIAAYCGPIRQRYEPFGGSSELRMADGTGFKQTHWRKTRIVCSGSGPLDPGLEQLDYSRPLELWCVKPLGMSGAALAFELPPASKRRPDVAPWAWAQVGDGWVDTPLSMVGDIATVVAVLGASSYRVSWLPRFEVLTDGVISDFDESRGLYDWSLEARER